MRKCSTATASKLATGVAAFALALLPIFGVALGSAIWIDPAVASSWENREAARADEPTGFARWQLSDPDADAEPATLAMLSLGIAGLASFRSRQGGVT